VYKKNDFVEIFKNSDRDIDLKIISLDYQNNYVENSSIMRNITRTFDISAVSLNIIILIVQQNYFQMYLAFKNVIDILLKLFFSYAK